MTRHLERETKATHLVGGCWVIVGFGGQTVRHRLMGWDENDRALIAVEDVRQTVDDAYSDRLGDFSVWTVADEQLGVCSCEAPARSYPDWRWCEACGSIASSGSGRPEPPDR